MQMVYSSITKGLHEGSVRLTQISFNPSAHKKYILGIAGNSTDRKILTKMHLQWRKNLNERI